MTLMTLVRWSAGYDGGHDLPQPKTALDWPFAVLSSRTWLAGFPRTKLSGCFFCNRSPVYFSFYLLLLFCLLCPSLVSCVTRCFFDVCVDGGHRYAPSPSIRLDWIVSMAVEWSHWPRFTLNSYTPSSRWKANDRGSRCKNGNWRAPPILFQSQLFRYNI